MSLCVSVDAYRPNSYLEKTYNSLSVALGCGPWTCQCAGGLILQPSRNGYDGVRRALQLSTGEKRSR